MSVTCHDAVRLRTGWLGSELVPYDEMSTFDDGVVTLDSGRRCTVPEPERPRVARALAPPEAAGVLAEDALALLEYVSGDHSPRRAAAAMMDMATAAGASDLHLVAEGERVLALLRLAGQLQDFCAMPSAIGARLVAALKHRSGCMPYRSDIAQEGRIPREGITADARASFLPTATGERAAVRLFGRLTELSQLGLEPELRGRLEQALGARSGLLLVAGPSGGGKTTTIYAALAWLARRRGDAHLSLEDPVEQRLRLAGIPVDQVELCPARGLSAEAALVAALRQDVDVLAVGEIRSAPEAALALEAAHTGRLVLAGVHAGSADEAVQRMLDLAAEPGVLHATLIGVLHQRLETLACPDCEGTDCAACAGLGRVRVPRATLQLAGEEA